MVGIDQVLANLDVALVDEHAGLVDGLGLEAFLIDPGLEALIKELVEGETEHVIELELLTSQQSVAMHAVEKGSAFEESSGVTFLKGEQLSGSLSESGKKKMDSPNFTLVLEAILADQLQFVIDTLLLEGTSWSVEGRRVYIAEQVQFL